MSAIRCQLIIDPPAAGSWNMALDEALLEAAGVDGLATLRLYQWHEPTLSLGYFQRFDERQQHTPSADCVVVRRQSGGGAIVHDHEVTYSLALPADHPASRNAPTLYRTVHDAIITALRVHLGDDPAKLLVRVLQQPQLQPANEPFLCFKRRAVGDVLCNGPDGGLHKILGSAQRRRLGAVLQHGSLLLATSDAAPELLGLAELADVRVSNKRLMQSLATTIAKALDLSTGDPVLQLASPVDARAREIERAKHAAGNWITRR